MEVKLTLTANAGVTVEIGQYCVWIDALHEDRQPGFSAVEPGILDKLPVPTHICYTHCHGDHFSRKLTEQALARWPRARVYLPENILKGQEWVTAEHCRFMQDDLTLEFFALPHEGMQYADVAHFGLMISVADKTVLVAGDCATGSPALLEAVGQRRIDVALTDFPWIALPKGRRVLAQMDIGHILVCHLPFAADDVNGYRPAAMRSLSAVDGDVRLLLEPLQRELFDV